METAASFEARYAPSSYPTYWCPCEVAGTTGGRRTKGPGREGSSTPCRSASANTNAGGITWAAEANKMSDR
jgi:hypothetical protein